MTRRFIDDIRLDINTVIVTNGTGEITASLLNPLMIDTLDSTIQDECSITGGITNNIPIGTGYTELTTAYNTNQGGDGVFLKPNALSGEIQTASTAGFTYSVNAYIQFEGAPNNDFVFSIFENGIAIGFETGETGEGNNDPVTAVARALVNSAPSNAVYTVAVKSTQASEIDIISISMIAIILPTNNP